MMRSLPRRSYSALDLASLSGGSVYSVVTVCGALGAVDVAGAAVDWACVFTDIRDKESTSNKTEAGSFMSLSPRIMIRTMVNSRRLTPLTIYVPHFGAQLFGYKIKEELCI